MDKNEVEVYLEEKIDNEKYKSILYITQPQIKYTFKNGAVIARPSMFLEEIPPGLIDALTIEEAY